MTAWRRRLVRIICVCVFLSGHSVLAEGEQGHSKNEDEIRAVIVLMRHGVRAPIASEIRDNSYNAQQWPSWPVAPGVLTSHGANALWLLGKYYRARYAVLLQNAPCNKAVYAEAADTERTIESTKALLSALVPGCSIDVHFTQGGVNPIFSDGDRLVDRQKLADAIDGKMADRPDWFTYAFAAPLEKMHHVLMDCSGSGCDPSKPDFRVSVVKDGITSPRSSRVESPVAVAADFAENFLLEYAEDMPMNLVGWGRVSRDDLNSLMEMNTRYHDFMLRTPYWSQIAESNLALRIRSTVISSATGKVMPGRIGASGARFIVLTGYDATLTWLGGLLRLDWLLKDQTFNATPPGSGLVFEVHSNRITGASTVQVFFISQTLDQIRYLRDLNGEEQPSVAPVFVPGCSGSAPEYACSVSDFARVVSSTVGSREVVSGSGPPNHAGKINF